MKSDYFYHKVFSDMDINDKLHIKASFAHTSKENSCHWHLVESKKISWDVLRTVTTQPPENPEEAGQDVKCIQK